MALHHIMSPFEKCVVNNGCALCFAIKLNVARVMASGNDQKAKNIGRTDGA